MSPKELNVYKYILCVGTSCQGFFLIVDFISF